MQAFAFTVASIGLATGFLLAPLDVNALFEDRSMQSLSRIRGEVFQSSTPQELLVDSRAFPGGVPARLHVSYDTRTIWLLGSGDAYTVMKPGLLPVGTQVAIFTKNDNYPYFYARYILIEPLI